VDDQLLEAESENGQAWDGVRRVREPLAWTLLAIAAVIVLVTACQLFNIAGAQVPLPVPASSFATRAAVLAPQFLAAVVIAPPLLAVALAAAGHGIAARARQVVTGAFAVQAATVLLAVICLAGAASSQLRPGTWFVLEGTVAAIPVAGLVFIGAVLASPSLRPAPLGPGFDDDADPDDDADLHVIDRHLGDDNPDTGDDVDFGGHY